MGSGDAGKGEERSKGDGPADGKEERSARLAELKAMLQEIEVEKAAAAPRHQGGGEPVVTFLLCILTGWLGAMIYHQDTIFAPPCAVCAVSEDLLATHTQQPQTGPSMSGLPPLRVAVVDEKKGPGATSVAVHRQAFGRVGFRVTEQLQEPYDFDVLWSHHSVNGSEHALTPMHRVNHIPGMSILCQKAQFGRFAHENRLEYVPRYYTSSVRDATYLAADLQKPGSRFVVKGRGHRGVRMMTSQEIGTIIGAPIEATNSGDRAESDGDGAVSKDGTANEPDVAAAAQMLMKMLQANVVQQFITDGLLVDGHKFDFAVYCYIDTFSPRLVAYTLENVRQGQLTALALLLAVSYGSMPLCTLCLCCSHLAGSIWRLTYCRALCKQVLIRVVPRPFPTTEAEWSDNKRLIVQDEYLTPWTLPTFKKLWTTHARGTLDAYLMQTLQAGHTQKGGFTGGALSAEAAKQRIDALWQRTRAIIWNSLQIASPKVQEMMSQHRKNGELNHQTFEFVRYDFMMDRQLNPWLIEVNMSPNMIPHDGEAHQDTQWRVAILQQVAALTAGHPEAVPSATLLTGEALNGMVGEEVSQAYVELRQLCLDDPSWRWSCDVPATKTPVAFSGACECTLGRLVQHKETKHYRCEKLGPECGGVGFETTLGYPVDFRWYETADGSEPDEVAPAQQETCGAK